MDASTLTRKYIEDRVEVHPTTKCWIWKLSANPATGYGQIGFKPYTAHRLAYALFIGTPDGVVRHACHNRLCCNPAHLRLGSHQDNYMDSLMAHVAADAARRGVAAGNAIRVVVGGVSYPSKVAAMKALRVGPATLARLIA